MLQNVLRQRAVGRAPLAGGEQLHREAGGGQRLVDGGVSDGRGEPVCCIKFVEKLLCNASDSTDLLVRFRNPCKMPHYTTASKLEKRIYGLYRLFIKES